MRAIGDHWLLSLALNTFVGCLCELSELLGLFYVNFFPYGCHESCLAESSLIDFPIRLFRGNFPKFFYARLFRKTCKLSQDLS